MQITSLPPAPPKASTGFQLTPQQEERILSAAAEHLHAALKSHPAPSAEFLGDIAQLSVMGAFVGAKRRARLRSCCGFIGHAAPLSHAISHAASRTATDDHRV